MLVPQTSDPVYSKKWFQNFCVSGWWLLKVVTVKCLICYFKSNETYPLLLTGGRSSTLSSEVATSRAGAATLGAKASNFSFFNCVCEWGKLYMRVLVKLYYLQKVWIRYQKGKQLVKQTFYIDFNKILIKFDIQKKYYKLVSNFAL